MSILTVEVRKIEFSRPHPNADRLDISRVNGLDYQFVTGRGQYSPGDLVVYFPIDTTIPLPIQEKIGVAGKLSGAHKNRVKTVKLRGEISQGLVAPVGVFEELGGIDLRTGTDVTDLLGCGKYEPPVIPVKGARLMTLPPEVEYYDLENAERYRDIVTWLVDNNISVQITEKLEGTNFALSLVRGEGITICSRRHAIVAQSNDREPDLIKVANRDGYSGLAYYLLDFWGADSVVLRGELVGPGWQGNIYGLTAQKIYLFDVKINGRYLPPAEWLWQIPAEYAEIGVNIAPELWRGKLANFLGEKTLKQASNGKSVLAPVAREGIVIRPLSETIYYSDFGRIILKQRSPEYLAGSDS